MDIECALCGEPWDAWGVYHHGDMTQEEARRFLNGEAARPANSVRIHSRVLPGGNLERFLYWPMRGMSSRVIVPFCLASS